MDYPDERHPLVKEALAVYLDAYIANMRLARDKERITPVSPEKHIEEHRRKIAKTIGLLGGYAFKIGDLVDSYKNNPELKDKDDVQPYIDQDIQWRLNHIRRWLENSLALFESQRASEI